MWVFHVEEQVKTYGLALEIITIYNYNIHYFLPYIPQIFCDTYIMKIFPIYFKVCSASKGYVWKPGKKKTSSVVVTYFETMHLLHLVQKQLQAAQKQANLLEGRDNLYQSVNIPIKEEEKSKNN